MGATSSIANFEVAQPLGSEWIKESRESYCAVLRNIETGEQAEQYVLASDMPVSNEFERYEYRLNQNQNLVSTWAVQVLNDEGVCNGANRLLVTNERIPLRLSEIRGLNFQDSLTVIHSSLIGFNAIHDVQGYVAVSDEMIGFTPRNHVKVWLNENFSENHPALPYRMVNYQYSGSTMVEQVIANVQEHSAEPLPSEFRNFFHSRFSPTSSIGSAVGIIEEYIYSAGIPINGVVTFSEGIPKVLHSEQYRTSYIQEVSPQMNSYVENMMPSNYRSTVVHQGQPMVTLTHEPPIRTIIQEPVHIMQPQPQHQIFHQPMMPYPIQSQVQRVTSIPTNPIHTQNISPAPIYNTRPMARSMQLGVQQRQVNNIIPSISPVSPIINQSSVVNRPAQPLRGFLGQSNLVQSQLVAPVPVRSEKVNIAPVSVIPQNRILTPQQRTQVIVNTKKVQSPTKVNIVQVPTVQRGQGLQIKNGAQVVSKPATAIQARNQQQFRVNTQVQNRTGSSTLEAERFLTQLNRNPRQASPQPPVLVSQQQVNASTKLNNLFEKKEEVRAVNVVQKVGPLSGIGQTLARYGAKPNTIQGPLVAKAGPLTPQPVVKLAQPPTTTIINGSPTSSVPVQHPHRNIVASNTATLRGPLNVPGQKPVYVAPKLQINQTRTINIDGVVANAKLDQSEQIFVYQQPKSPVGILPGELGQGVAEGLKNAIRQIDRDISITSSRLHGDSILQSNRNIEKKQDDLIQYMKDNIQPEIIVEQRIEYERHDYGKNAFSGSEGALSQQVQDLLKNYEFKKDGEATFGSYESRYQTNDYKIENPIIVFNEDPLNRIQNKYGYDKPSDDYESLRAKYQTKYESNKDIDVDHKYETYDRDYTSQNKYNTGDPLIIFNTKKPDVVSRGYKSGDYEARNYKDTTNYENYSGYSKHDNYDHKDRYSKYDAQVKYTSGAYGKEYSPREVKYGEKHGDKYEDKYGDKYGEKYGDKYQSRYQKKGRGGREDRENRVEGRDYGNSRGYGTRERVQGQQSQGRNLSYHDLRSLLYD